jgi:uncharacterized protein
MQRHKSFMPLNMEYKMSYYKNIKKSIKKYIDPNDEVEEQELFEVLKQQELGVFESILGSLPAEDVLTQEEMRIFNSFDLSESIQKTNSKRNKTVVMKLTRLCNLRCDYCFSWAEGKDQTMTFSVLAKTIYENQRGLSVENVTYVWHGGEVTILGVKIFIKLIWLQSQFKREGQNISNALQTNGVKVSDEWFEFIELLRLPVGLSMDGIPDVNDIRRKKIDGSGSSEDVINFIDRVKKSRVQLGCLVVIDKSNSDMDVEQLFNFFISKGVVKIDFLNYTVDSQDINRALSSSQHLISTDSIDPRFISFPEFCEFMLAVFNIWKSKYQNRIKVRFLEKLIDAISNESGIDNCYFEGGCLDSIFTIEPDGTIDSCDRLIGLDRNLCAEHPSSDCKSCASNHIETFAHQNGMSDCHWFHLCNGGCPHDRIAGTALSRSYSGSCCGMQKLLESIRSYVLGEQNINHKGVSQNESININ